MTDQSLADATEEHTIFAEYADALEVLARIHDREADGEFIDGLRENGVAAWLEDLAETPASSRAASRFAAALAAFSDPADSRECEILAVEYADIYLTHSYRVSPAGSVWLTDDNLERQEPMFEVRKWYRHYRVETPDWRKRSDDHIVHQLQFVAFLLRGETDQFLGDAARFLDTSLLKWLPDFAARVDERCHSEFYKSAAELTAALVDELRELLERTSGVLRPQPEPEPKKRKIPKLPAAQPYFPGQSESW